MALDQQDQEVQKPTMSTTTLELPTENPQGDGAVASTTEGKGEGQEMSKVGV